MEIEVREQSSCLVVLCRGRMDAEASGPFKERIAGLCASGVTRLVVDLSGVDFLDSSGLGALVACLRKVREKHGDIKLAGLRPEVKSIFEITRVSRLFQICADAAEASSSFQE